MLGVPCKRSWDQDWKPLREHIKSQYSDEAVADVYLASVDKLNSAREGVLAACTEPNRDGLDKLSRYFAQLKSLELRAPVSKGTDGGAGRL